MGLLRGVARTAVVAGTATAVSNRVSRRQGERWAAQEQQQAATQIPTQYAPPPQEPQYAPPPQEEDLTEKLDRLASLHHRGQITDEEYAAAKAKLLEL